MTDSTAPVLGTDGTHSRRWRWLRALVGLVLLGGLLLTLDLDTLVDALLGARWGPALAAFLLLMLIRGIRAARWRELLTVYGVHSKLSRLTAIVFVGHFFNLFLPTAVGGDVARGYLAVPENDDLPVSYGIVLVERFLGMITLAAVALTAVLLSSLSPGAAVPPVLLRSVGAASAVVLTVGLLPLVWHGWRRWIQGWADGRFGEGRISTILEGLMVGFDVLRRSEAPKVRILLLSLVVQLTAITFYVAVAVAVELKVPYLSLFLIVPVASVAAMVPVSINGLGVREGVLVALLTAHGATSVTAGALAVLALLLTTVASLTGGVVYALHPELRRRGVAVDQPGSDERTGAQPSRRST